MSQHGTRNTAQIRHLPHERTMTIVATLVFQSIFAFLIKNSSAFSVLPSAKPSSIRIPPKLQNRPVLDKTFSNNLCLFASKNEDEDIMVDQTTAENPNIENEIVSVFDRIRVLSYRSTLFLTSLGFLVSCAVTLLQDSGLGYDTVVSLQQSSHVTIIWGSCLTLLIIPPLLSSDSEVKSNNTSTDLTILTILNKIIPILAVFAILFELIIAIQANLSIDETTIVEISPSVTADPISAVLLSVVCVREILYYGIGFKVEAVVAIALFLGQALIPDLPEFVTTSGLALALLVLSVGKVFEPIQTDLIPDKSSFFVKDI